MFSKTHVEPRKVQDNTQRQEEREGEGEREKQCVGTHDEHSSNPILLILIVSSFCI
jgi:hypothetical protein